MRPLVRLLDHGDEVSLVGGKGRSLQQLRAIGARVPEAVVLTTAFGEALDRGQREEARARCLEEVSRRLGGGPVIVRSSAVGEDGEGAAFAGLLESIFPVDGGDVGALAEAVARCRASSLSPRVAAYEHAKGVRLAGVAVVVQRLVDCSASGVLFTDGVTLRGEWCRGHGQALVDGALTPGAFRLDRRVREGRPACAVIDREADDGSGFPLSDGQAAELVEAATTLERRRGVALDIEWAVDRQGQLWLLQARPVTHTRTELWSNANISENFPTPVTPLLLSFSAAGYSAYFRNLGVAFGLDEARLARHERAFETIVGAHGSRLYYNLSSIHEVLRLMPFGDWIVDSFDAFVGAGASLPGGSEAFDELGLLVRVIGRVALAYRDLPARVARFERAVDEVASKLDPARLSLLSDRELSAGLRAIVEIRLRRWLDASLADCAAAVTYKLLGAFLGAIDGQSSRPRSGASPDAAERHHALLKGLDVAGAWSLRGLWELAEHVARSPAARASLASCLPLGEAGFSAFRASIDDALGARVDRWLARYGFRGSGELLLTEPSVQESPWLLLPLLARYVEAIDDPSQPSPARALERQRAERIERTSEIAGRLDGARAPLRPVFRRLLAASQASVQLRERARFRQALLYTRLRAVALASGRRLVERGIVDHPGDAFFVTFEELDRLVLGQALSDDGSTPDLRQVIARRRAEHEALSALDLPDVFALARGSRVTPSDTIGALSSREAREARAAGALAIDEDVLSGIPASGGLITGRAAVLSGLADASKLAPGDILVARQTDPGWAPLFFLVRGLVLERGGMLSHGSILARELGIPSVVGVAQATEKIAHGKTLTLDGDAGRVRIS